MLAVPALNDERYTGDGSIKVSGRIVKAADSPSKRGAEHARAAEVYHTLLQRLKQQSSRTKSLLISNTSGSLSGWQGRMGRFIQISLFYVLLW